MGYAIERESTKILDDFFGAKEALTAEEFEEVYKEYPILQSPIAIRLYL